MNDSDTTKHELPDEKPSLTTSLGAAGDPAPVTPTLDPDSRPSTLAVNVTDKTPEPHLVRTKHRNLLGPKSIAFYIGDLDDPLIKQFAQEITLGRYVGLSSNPSIDLTPYDAFEAGVSRTHARIYRHENALWFEDLGSANGSYINAERMSPYAPHKLQQGDLIKLGVLILEIYFGIPESFSALPNTGKVETRQHIPEVVEKSATTMQPIKDIPRSSGAGLPTTGESNSDKVEPPKGNPEVVEQSATTTQPIQGIIQFSTPNLATAIEVKASLSILMETGVGENKSQMLKFVVSAEVNDANAGLAAEAKRLLDNNTDGTEFTLTLK